MRWDLEWGEHLKDLLDFQKESGITPDALRSRPELPWQYHFYLKVFRILNRDRQLGGMGGFGFIPTSAFESFCSAFQIDSLSEREHLLRVVHKLDDAFVEYHAEKQKKTASSNVS